MAVQIASLFATIGSDISGFKKGAQEVKKDLGAMGSQTGQFTASSLLNWAKIGAAVMAAKKTFDFAKEGAQLDYAQTRFERLAKGAGSMSQVLMNDLRNATRGMYSDAELMASAGDLMALGLAKTHDEAVRLASVAGALDMNMNQLVLTMTNQTTMRFDALGVAVDGFDEKVDALIETGMSAEEAFGEAFLQQAEAQIEKVGHAADTTLGAFKRLSAQGGTAWENFKIQLAKAFEPVVEGLADFLENSNNVDRAVSLLGATFVQQTRDMQGNYHAVYELNGAYITLEELLRLAEGALNKSAKAVRYAAGSHGELESAALNVAAALGRVNDVNTNLIDSMQSMYNKARLAALGIADVEKNFENATAQFESGALTLDEYNAVLRDGQVAALLANVAIGTLGNEEAQAQLLAYGLKLAEVKALLDGISSGKYSAELIINLIGTDRGFSVAAAMAIAEDKANGWAGLRNAQSAAANAGYENRASGGPLNTGGWTLIGEGPSGNSPYAELVGPDGIVRSPAETKQLLPLLGLLGIRPRGMAGGGRLLDGNQFITKPGNTSAFGTVGNISPARQSWQVSAQAAAQAAAQPLAAAQAAQAAAAQAAQAAAVGVGSSVAQQGQQQAERAMATFAAETRRSNNDLLAEVRGMRKASAGLPSKNDLKNAIREAVAEIA